MKYMLTSSATGGGYAYRIATVAAAAGLLFGFDIAVINGALVFLRAQFALSTARPFRPRCWIFRFFCQFSAPGFAAPPVDMKISGNREQIRLDRVDPQRLRVRPRANEGLRQVDLQGDR